MREIRLCRSCNGRQDPMPEPPGGGVWHPDTPGNREALNTIAEAGKRRATGKVLEGLFDFLEKRSERTAVPAEH